MRSRASRGESQKISFVNSAIGFTGSTINRFVVSTIVPPRIRAPISALLMGLPCLTRSWMMLFICSSTVKPRSKRSMGPWGRSSAAAMATALTFFSASESPSSKFRNQLLPCSACFSLCSIDKTSPNIPAAEPTFRCVARPEDFGGLGFFFDHLRLSICDETFWLNPSAMSPPPRRFIIASTSSLLVPLKLSTASIWLRRESGIFPTSYPWRA